MTKLIQTSLMIVITIFMTACLSAPKDSVSKIVAGMDKADVLEISGDPEKVDRANGHDRWRYTNAAGETVYVFFAEGKVQYVGPQFPVEKTKAAPKTQSTGSFQDIKSE